jgi:hypothetical protein
MKKIEVQMSLYILTKKIMEVQGNMLNPFGIILFYNVVGWFVHQNIHVGPRRPRFNPLYQHILCGVYIFIYIFVHACKCIILRWVVDK